MFQEQNKAYFVKVCLKWHREQSVRDLSVTRGRVVRASKTSRPRVAYEASANRKQVVRELRTKTKGLFPRRSTVDCL